MQRVRNFKDLVLQSFFDEIENRVSLYVEKNYRDMEFQSHKVSEVDEATTQEQELYRIVAYDTLGDTLSFDAIVIADVDIYQVDRNKDLEDTIRKWFRVSCEVDVADGFSNFRILNVDDEYDHNVNNQRKTLDDALVPVIGSAYLEEYAEEIMCHVYPEALKKPMRVDVEQFAERLDLKIVRKHLSRNGTIFGQMIFHPTNVDYYDLDKKGFSTYEADGGTIFADDEVFFLRNLGSWNNTIIHECVHWLKHRKHIELKRAAGGDVSRISCQVTEVPPETKKRKRTDTEWMEWHANALAPRILMPREQFKQKADELIAWHMNDRGTNKLSDVIGVVILDLHEFFEVSVLSAKIRMLDIGYTEAIGVYDYVDGEYAPSHAVKQGTLNNNQTFTVPMKEGLIQYAIDPKLRAILDTGNFVYIKGRYVINAPKYVTSNEYGTLEMTEYALENMDECCLSFERSSRDNPDFGAKQYTECILFQHAASKHLTIFEYKDTEGDKSVVANAVAIRAEMDEVKSAAMVMGTLTDSFGDSLKKLMTWRGVTVEALAERALVNTRMIERMRADENRTWDILKVSALCIGLQLPPYMSLPLIKKAGLAFRAGEEQYTYQHILTTRYTSNIRECNELLAEAGFKPFSDDE